jgi:hypothetical protein
MEEGSTMKKNTYWPISEAYLKKEKCCVVGCKKKVKYEFLSEQSEDPHDTLLLCEDHLPKKSVPL